MPLSDVHLSDVHRSEVHRSEVRRRPTLLNSCAMAATAAEAKFRISYPFLPRDSRIIAVDAAAAPTVRRVAAREWAGNARFLSYERAASDGVPSDAVLRAADGSETTLSEELADADVAVMVAGRDDSATPPADAAADAVTVIGRACTERRIMTAGVVVSESGTRVDDAVLALRPYAMVLVAATEDDDLAELLTALRV